MIAKEKSLGIVVISWIEMIVGSLIAFIAVLILSYDYLTYIVKKSNNHNYSLDEYKLIVIFCIIVFSLTFLAGMLTNKLNPIGRILNIFLSVCCIIFYICEFLLCKGLILIEYFFKPFSLGFFPWLITYVPIVLSTCFIIFFTNPNVKEQFK
ncbi:MAG: hypothetical protein PHS66_06940 [Candidatus Omnitrophica bacterium]|nr:hypothetical protein [Candidatus Omnitrophota bacterium]